MQTSKLKQAEHDLSLGQAMWRSEDVPMEKVQDLVRRHDVPEIVARLLIGRGIEGQEVASFLYPTLKTDFPDPLRLKGMAEACAFMDEALRKGLKAGVLGDFDVDGATSVAVLYRFMTQIGQAPPIYIPDRLKEGYGPNENALASLKEQGADIVFLLDCGITAHKVIESGRQMGLEIVVIDHHEPEESLPPASHVVNPKRRDDDSGLDMLAAVGVTFLFCVALNAQLRSSGYYSEKGISEPDLRQLLDLVAIGTVCDMVPLLGANRVLVKHGLPRSAETRNVGLRALKSVSGLEGEVTPYHAGFVIGPRINAVSRVQRSDVGARLLCTEDAAEATDLAWILNDCNDKRKAIQVEMEQQAIHRIESGGMDEQPILIVGDKDWHPGLSGLVAGRLKEKYHKPACVMTYTTAENGQEVIRGSGRSVPGVNMAEALIAARGEGLLINGGGHAMAGGFTLDPACAQAFQAFMAHHVNAQVAQGGSYREYFIDANLTVQGCTPALINTIHKDLGPFGQSFDEPLFCFRGIRVVSSDVVGKAHIRTMIQDREGAKRMKAMAFRAVDTPLGNALLKGDGSFDLLCRVKVDRWTEQERAEAHIVDGRISAAF